MRRIADLYPGDAKTDEKDAFIIADAARSLPHTLRELTEADVDEATLSMLTGFDLDLSRQVNQASNRIRGLFTQVHPALEKVLGLRLEHDAILEMLISWPTPEKLRKAGRARIDAKLKKYGARRHAAWTDEILTALAKQTVTVTGTDAAGIVIPHLARQLIHLHEQRVDVAQEVEEIVVNHPLYRLFAGIEGTRARVLATNFTQLPCTRVMNKTREGSGVAWPALTGASRHHLTPQGGDQTVAVRRCQVHVRSTQSEFADAEPRHCFYSPSPRRVAIRHAQPPRQASWHCMSQITTPSIRLDTVWT